MLSGELTEGGELLEVRIEGWADVDQHPYLCALSYCRPCPDDPGDESCINTVIWDIEATPLPNVSITPRTPEQIAADPDCQ